MSRELDYDIALLMGDRPIKRGRWKGYWDCGKGRHYSDEDGGPLHYSEDMNAAWCVVEKMHAGIDPATMGPYQYLTLVCTGAYGENWAASFDFNLDADWIEDVERYPFAARATTPALAICRAALNAAPVGARGRG